MFKNKMKFAIVFLIAVMLNMACQKDKFEIKKSLTEENSGINENQMKDGTIALGAKLEDPYNIKNMRKAFDNLKSLKSDIPDIEIEPTHLYIRYLPKNEIELSLLKADTTLILYDHPLDYKIKKNGTHYHDPTLPKNAITWQYCVVPIEYETINVHNQLIYEVYIHENDDNLKTTQKQKEFFYQLERESAKLTGNLPNQDKGTLAYWTPKGTIKAWDNIIGSSVTYTNVFDHWECYDCKTGKTVECNDPIDPMRDKKLSSKICRRAVYKTISNFSQGSYIPLNQVAVYARWFTNIKSDLTDENGYFETGSFRYDVDYDIKWERGLFDIRDGVFSQAWYYGPTSTKGDWNVYIKGGSSGQLATMHRAAYKQFYGNNLNIHRPITSGKVKLRYHDENGRSVCYGDWPDLGIAPDIRIYGKATNGSYRNVDRIFATTTHELAHLSLWVMIGWYEYAQRSKRIYESWAAGVEWALTNDEYHTMGARFGSTAAIDYEYRRTFQFRWPVDLDSDALNYTPIFIDLMDNFNQRAGGLVGGVSYTANSNLPNDLISGYSLSFIQYIILGNSYGISSLRDAVKANKISGVTDAEIDQLFELYWTN